MFYFFIKLFFYKLSKTHKFATVKLSPLKTFEIKIPVPTI